MDDVSFDLDAGQVLGLVGESGSGKTTVGRMVCGLERRDSGIIELDGIETPARPNRDWWMNVQMVPQDATGSLNPAMTVREIVSEPARFVRGQSRSEANETASTLLEQVGLHDSLGDRRPTRLSGGQRQRVAVARALAAQPRLLVCDESTSALDVSVQAQILILLKELQLEFGFSMLFVTHDISVVRYLADDVLVMQRGRLVERAAARDLTAEGVTHPYTAELLASVPTLPDYVGLGVTHSGMNESQESR
ncbi:ATP-binding cassette domain-containing protein [Rhodococcus sp. IEGM 1381]|uniref:ABC transporter ATP-binding protein n=1 Tax=Rhodococcus sp. IEGM 1381 TaxID=3047085 RepID=UPI0024B75C6A|nr:ATP-binding cassette domain-containing protein [Rhodococcus sp. IEGM 1381]MDI9894436.1 ATP-binding cassette domain-containing protein [Rhodococcus sp. IEGM 1381]